MRWWSLKEIIDHQTGAHIIMLTGYQTAEELTQNLIDAGCGQEMIVCLLSCLSEGCKTECLCQLEERRAELLGDIHKEQSGLAFLDELLADLREQA